MNGKRKSILPVWLRNMLWGLLISWAVVTILCMIGAFLISAGSINQEQGHYCTLLTLLIAAFAGALPAKYCSNEKAAVWCLIQGAAFFGTLLILGSMLFDGSISGIGVTALVTMSASTVTALLGKRERKGIRKAKRKYKIGAFV